jgi:type II secretory pathway component GspD/PulD (secretin)
VDWRDGSFILQSEDVKALDQFEALVRTVSQHGGAIGRNLNVFMLHNAQAAVVADMLTRIYRTTPAGRRGGTAAGTIVVIPDPRLNALIVHANRSDRPTIENLVRMLDVAQVPDSLAVTRMKIIPVKNTSATGVAQMLGKMFQNYVDSIGVEERTNSLVVMGPTAMTEEVGRFVMAIDQAAGGDPLKQVRLVPLQKTNAMRMQQELNSVLGQTPGRPAGATAAGNNGAASSIRILTTAPAAPATTTPAAPPPAAAPTSPPVSTVSPPAVIPSSFSTLPASTPIVLPKTPAIGVKRGY